MYVIRLCDVYPYGKIALLPQLVAASRLLDIIADSKFLAYVLLVTFKDSGDRMTAQAKSAVQSVLTHGLDLFGRRYKFLASSSDQLRTGGACFFCENNDQACTVKWIREQVGNFGGITNRFGLEERKACL